VTDTSLGIFAYRFVHKPVMAVRTSAPARRTNLHRAEQPFRGERLRPRRAGFRFNCQTADAVVASLRAHPTQFKRGSVQAGLPGTRAPCNDVTRIRVLAARFARGFLENLAPPSNRGRGECRVPNAPAAWCALKGSQYAHQSSQRRHRKTSGIPHAMVLRLITRSPRRRIPLATVAPRIGWHLISRLG
jgi:hypothetical protein